MVHDEVLQSVRPDITTEIPAIPSWTPYRGTLDLFLTAAGACFAISCVAAAVIAGRSAAAAAAVGGFTVLVFGARLAIGVHARNTGRSELAAWLSTLPFEVRGLAIWLADVRAPIDVIDEGAHEVAEIADLHGCLAYRVGDARIRIELPRGETRSAEDVRLLGQVLTSLAPLDGIAVELGGPLRR